MLPAQIGQILFGGGRFVADQVTNGYYRIPLPGASATWGWVKPEQPHGGLPPADQPLLQPRQPSQQRLPHPGLLRRVTNKAMFGRPKFHRSVVKAFSPTAPGGDGKVLFVTDAPTTAPEPVSRPPSASPATETTTSSATSISAPAAYLVGVRL